MKFEFELDPEEGDAWFLVLRREYVDVFFEAEEVMEFLLDKLKEVS